MLELFVVFFSPNIYLLELHLPLLYFFLLDLLHFDLICLYWVLTTTTYACCIVFNYFNLQTYRLFFLALFASLLYFICPLFMCFLWYGHLLFNLLKYFQNSFCECIIFSFDFLMCTFRHMLTLHRSDWKMQFLAYFLTSWLIVLLTSSFNVYCAALSLYVRRIRYLCYYICSYHKIKLASF